MQPCHPVGSRPSRRRLEVRAASLAEINDEAERGCEASRRIAVTCNPPSPPRPPLSPRPRGYAGARARVKARVRSPLPTESPELARGRAQVERT